MFKAAKYTWPLLFALTRQFSFAQNQKIDSLQAVLRTAREDTNKVNTLNNLFKTELSIGNLPLADSLAKITLKLAEKLDFKRGIAYAYINIGNVCYSTGNYKDALTNFSESMKVAEASANKLGIANAYGGLGNAHRAQGNYPDALKEFSLSLKIDREINNKQGIGAACSNLGTVYYSQGNYPEALKSLLEALTVFKELGNKQYIGNVYTNIGNIYYLQGNYPKSLENHLACLAMQKEIGYKQGMISSYTNIGNIYFDQNRLKEALESHLQALKLTQEIGDRQGESIAYTDIGNVYYKLNNFEEALNHFRFSEELCRQIGNYACLCTDYENTGVILVKQKKYAQARQCLDSAMRISKRIGQVDIIRDSYAAWAVLDSASGNFAAAYDNFKNYIQYRDSLKNDEYTKKILSEQMTYDFEEKENKLKADQDKQNAVSEEKLKRQKLITWSAAGSLGFVLLCSVLLFNRSRLKQKNRYQLELNRKQKEQAIAVMETQEQERKRIAEDLHDSLGHLLSTIRLNLQASSQDQKKSFENSLQLLQQASQEIHNITFNLMPRTLEEEGLIPALHEMAGRITNANVKIGLQLHEVENLSIEKQTQFTIYRIVQEAVNNILKYAESREINIQLIRRGNELVIMIEDDGKGFNVEEVKKGRGLKNMMSRSEWLNGRLAIDSGNGRGTTIIVEIPI